jgi:hypothetical protein
MRGIDLSSCSSADQTIEIAPRPWQDDFVPMLGGMLGRGQEKIKRKTASYFTA